MAIVEQRKTASVERGIFLVHYVSAEDEACPPRVMVAVDPRCKRDLELILYPEHSDAVLWQPGSCLVVRASNPGQLIIEVTPSVAAGSSAATVKIEPLSQGETRPATATISDGHEFRVLGHVAGIGDVVVGADQWLAGPAAPSRIEGLAIEWPDKPDDVTIRYAVNTARPQAGSGRMVEVGSFAGTRGRAMPIVEVRIEMSGSGAARYQLIAETIFLGSPAQRVSGRRVTFAGPTGREPLVGLRLNLDGVSAPADAPVAPARKTKPSGHVRVFRGSTAAAASA